MTRSLRTTLRATALLGVAALAAGTLGLVAAPALAAPGDGGSGSITVHKYEQMQGNLGPNDGTQLDLSGMSVNPLAAGFTACTVGGIDLQKANDWTRLKDLVITAGATPATQPSVKEGNTSLALSCGPQQTTSALDGITTFANLPADKAYVVFESAPPKNALKIAAPSLITVPYPGASSTAWNYNPHIYPKNTIVGSGATKTGKGSFGNYSYTITVPIKALPAGETFTEFAIEDQLADHLVYLRKATVRLTNGTGGGVALTAGDYTLTGDVGVAKTKVVLTLTPSGLAKLDNSIGGKIVLSFPVETDDFGDTRNSALIRINGAASLGQRAVRGVTPYDLGGSPEIEDPTWAYMNQHYMVYEENSSGVRTPVAGAGIQSYMHPDPNATSCPATPDELFDHDDWDWGLMGPSASEVMSGADGIALMYDAGLFVGPYCGYMEIVPNGYKAPTAPVFLIVKENDGEFDFKLERDSIDISNLPALPLTGAAGSVTLIGTGGALLLAAGALAFARRRGFVFGAPRSAE